MKNIFTGLSLATMLLFPTTSLFAASDLPDKVHLRIAPLSVACGDSAELMKAFGEKNELVLKSVDIMGGIFLAFRNKDGMTFFMTSPAETKGAILCIVTAVPAMKLEKNFGKPGGTES